MLTYKFAVKTLGVFILGLHRSRLCTKGLNGSGFHHVLIHSDCCDKSTVNYVAYKQQTVISHRLESLSLAVSHMAERAREHSGGFFTRAVIPLMGLLPHDVIISQRPHLQTPSH